MTLAFPALHGTTKKGEWADVAKAGRAKGEGRGGEWERVGEEEEEEGGRTRVRAGPAG